MFELLIKVLLAHFLGDFVFQTDHSIADLKKNRFKSKYLYLHFIIHFALLWVFTGMLIPALLLSIVHILIDILTKFYMNQEKYRVKIFVADQLLHFLSIAAFVYYFYHYSIPWEDILTLQTYLLLTTLVTLTYVSSVIIKIVMAKYSPVNIELGTKNAGKIIGMLERLFIFGFIMMGFPYGIGFLLAAKSIFRFGDLKENKDIKLTEYILIGTLLSFGLAMLISKIYAYFLSQI